MHRVEGHQQLQQDYSGQIATVDHMSDSDKSFNRNVRVSAWIDVKKLSPKQMPRMNISEPRAAAWRVVLLV